MAPRVLTVDKEKMGSRILLSARCKIPDDTSDVLSRGHQYVDSLE